MQTDHPPEKSAADERLPELSEEMGSKLKMEKEEEREDTEKSMEAEEEFSFASVQSEESAITAEEAFKDGHIKPVYPVFDRNLIFEYHQDAYVLFPDAHGLRKVFLEESSMAEEPQGPFCSWSGKTQESCRKSSSTGFSRLWRFRELLLRSSSEGKDAFVFISNDDASSSSSKEKEKKKGKEETVASVHEKLYVKSRANREEAKRRSYLPYKQVGFFTDVHGLSKNVHPF